MTRTIRRSHARFLYALAGLALPLTLAGAAAAALMAVFFLLAGHPGACAGEVALLAGSLAGFARARRCRRAYARALHR